MNHTTPLDALVIGGSYAGLSAALQLARARRRIAVVDAGQRRNRFARSSHGFLGQDGRSPQDIVDDARAQLLAYPTVQWVDGHATAPTAQGDTFSVTTPAGPLTARRLLIATGVADTLPPIEGLAERWGRSVFHCPYCHGYELDQGAIGVLAVGPMSMHHALLLPDWGPTTFFLNGSFEPDAAQLAQLQARGVTVERSRVTRISGTADVHVADAGVGKGGRTIALAGLFTATKTRLASPLAEQLGCALDEGPIGPVVRRNEMLETTVPGVFACGDAARPFGNVATSVGDGAMAGASVHRSLIPGF